MKVLVVDDSIVFRKGITMAFDGVHDIEVIGTANNGKVGVERVKQLKPDLITLDLEMPVMDGVTAIKEIRQFDKDVIILVFSAISERGAKITLEALENGADDFITKGNPGSGSLDDSIENLKQELLPRVLQFVPRIKTRQTTSHLTASGPATQAPSSSSPTSGSSLNITPITRASRSEKIAAQTFLPDLPQFFPKLIAIGSSTGGPEILKKIFSHFDAENFIPIVIAQHMPPFFTAQLADMINKKSTTMVKEAVEGDVLEEGCAYIAPGDYHMELELKDNQRIVRLNQKEKLHFVRPAADYLFQSIANFTNNDVLGVILTGMGEDGARGMQMLKEKNATVLIQDEVTSTVWGMPGATYELKVQDGILNPKQIADYINKTNEKFKVHKARRSS